MDRQAALPPIYPLLPHLVPCPVFPREVFPRRAPPALLEQPPPDSPSVVPLCFLSPSTCTQIYRWMEAEVERGRGRKRGSVLIGRERLSSQLARDALAATISSKESTLIGGIRPPAYLRGFSRRTLPDGSLQELIDAGKAAAQPSGGEEIGSITITVKARGCADSSSLVVQDLD